jgi:Glycosyl Hydrolase Family 88
MSTVQAYEEHVQVVVRGTKPDNVMTKATDLLDDKSQTQRLYRTVTDNKHVEKIWRVAHSRSEGDEDNYPHVVLPGSEKYTVCPLQWWTSGFFPGSLWILYERSVKRPLPIPSDELLRIAKAWSANLESEKLNTSTHDLGFMLMPSFQREYNLTGSPKAAEIIVEAARSLSTRFDEKVQCIRSWNSAETGDYKFFSTDRDFLVAIDNMMNLDLLYSASAIAKNRKFADLATAHAEKTLKYHIRPDFSTFHMIVYDPVSGDKKIGLTHQGYSHESTWSRGQAWALYGYATVYKYTRNIKYLAVAKRLADYFLSRVDDGIVYWDFDAPRPCEWDTSAAMIACSGMLLICQLENSKEYLESVVRILQVCVERAMGTQETDSILMRATVANYKYYKNKLVEHGLVYADYYFLEVGNRLIDMGLINV